MITVSSGSWCPIFTQNQTHPGNASLDVFCTKKKSKTFEAGCGKGWEMIFTDFVNVWESGSPWQNLCNL